VSVYLWAHVPELQEWQFMIATPLVDRDGPLAAYKEVNKALQREGLLDEVPASRIFLKSPRDPVMKSLEKESRAVPQETFRVVNEQIMGNFVEDAYLYAGFVSIARLQGRGDQLLYSVFYAPYTGAGGLVPSVNLSGVENLRDFLINKLRIPPSVVESTLQELSTKVTAAIPNVRVRPQELKRLGLA
jgi:hypothetical protein